MFDCITITKRIEFDAGHRLPNHNSKCRNLHGHHYVLEVSIKGPVNANKDASSEGMLVDFSEIKEILATEIIAPWDHAFFIDENDLELAKFLDSITDHKTVRLPSPPTVECLAKQAFEIIDSAIGRQYNNLLSLDQVRLYETPNSWAEVKSPAT